MQLIAVFPVPNDVAENNGKRKAEIKRAEALC